MELLPFQKEAVEQSVKLLLDNGCVYNASEMGVGKTPMTIQAVRRLTERHEPKLVICPSVVKYVWHKMLYLWLDSPKVTVIEKASDYKKDILSADWVIMSYDIATKLAPSIGKVGTPIAALIVDESHALKNTRALRTKKILKHIWPLAKYKICLSGTPFTQSIADCWPIFSRMHPDFKDYWEFLHRYTHVQRTPWGEKPTGVKNAEELSKKIRERFFIRYRKADVLKELPPKTWSQVLLPSEYAVKLTEEEEKDYEGYLRLLKESFAKGTPLRAVPPKSVSTIRREQGLKKVKAVVSFVKEIVDQDIPVVVFFHHKEVGKVLAKEFEKLSPSFISGETPGNIRAEQVARFQDGWTRLFLGSISASGVGITLTKSSVCVFAEMSYSPSEMQQAASRCHRIGQTDNVTCYYFEVEGSVDSRIVDILIEKTKSFDEVLNGPCR